MFNESFNTQSIRTIEDLDAAAIRLAAIWGESFSPAPKFDSKKNKLRDIVSKLAGYKNGYQSFLAALKEAMIPTTQDIFELPDKLIVQMRPWDLEDEMVVGKYDENASYLDIEHDTHIATLLNEDEGGDLIGQYGELKHVPIWQYICEHYEACEATIEMPNIEKYGILEQASDLGAKEMVENVYLTTNDDFVAIPNDRGDDGSAWAFIKLVRKA
jgi:hypothetical protein